MFFNITDVQFYKSYRIVFLNSNEYFYTFQYISQNSSIRNYSVLKCHFSFNMRYAKCLF